MNSATRKTSAFTLVELMVSIGLVLILMIGVSQVFKIISGTVSAGSAISDNTRNARGAQATLAQDFNDFAKDGPSIILHSETIAAFRNRADMLADRDMPANPTATTGQNAARTIDINGDNQEGNGIGERVLPATYNYRNHRTDSFSFFVRGLFKRQTGGAMATNGASPFIADQSSTEAWIWYGIMRIANDAGSLTTAQDPGAGTLGENGNNYFASNWILGREALLLVEKDSTDKIKDRNGVDQIFIDGMTNIPATGRPDLQPLAYASGANVGTASGGAQNNTSRFDLASTSIGEFKQRLNIYLQRSIANPPPQGSDWFDLMFGSGGRRFKANPVLSSPITPAILSQQYPIFVRGCTQFIVEYAGDFVSQVPDPALPTWGNVDAVFAPAAAGAPSKTDGQIDYVIIGTGANRKKQIRWYGLPRDTNGDGSIPGWIAARTNNQMPDVVPLRDVMRTCPGEATNDGAPFEKYLAASNGNKLPAPTGTNNNVSPPVQGDYLAATNGMTATGEYTAAWGPNDRKPSMIRITIVLDDPQGRNPNPDGQIFEYVFQLP